LEIPSLTGDPDPIAVRAKYREIIAACRSVLTASALNCQVVYLLESAGFQADSPSGWSLIATFVVVVVDIIQ
jgi:hypothetical protein